MNSSIPGLDTEQFKTQVGFFEKAGKWRSQATLPILVYFFGENCTQCQRVKPQLEEVAQKWSEKVLFFKVDTDLNPELVQLFRVRSIPAFLLLAPGQNPLMTFGFMTELELSNTIQEKLLSENLSP